MPTAKPVQNCSFLNLTMTILYYLYNYYKKVLLILGVYGMTECVVATGRYEDSTERCFIGNALPHLKIKESKNWGNFVKKKCFPVVCIMYYVKSVANISCRRIYTFHHIVTFFFS